MTISDRTRKLLWGLSGSRCAICHQELVMIATANDDESIVGDECHIVARNFDGPRGNPAISEKELDDYSNLILLCKVHHKLIDDQPNTYPVDRIREIKLTHEKWVQETLGLKPANSSSDKLQIGLIVVVISTCLFLVLRMALPHLFDTANSQITGIEGAAIRILKVIPDPNDITITATVRMPIVVMADYYLPAGHIPAVVQFGYTTSYEPNSGYHWEFLVITSAEWGKHGIELSGEVTPPARSLLNGEPFMIGVFVVDQELQGVTFAQDTAKLALVDQ